MVSASNIGGRPNRRKALRSGYHSNSVALLLVFGSLLPAQPAKTTITSAAEVRQLGPAEARKESPVSIRAVVTYVNAQSGELFVQDSSAGIFVFFRNSTSDVALHSGQLVKIEGITAAGDFASSITKARITVVGRAEMPKPVELPFDEILTGEQDSQWGHLAGLVRSGREEAGVLYLNAVTPGGEFLIIMKDYPADWATTLVDSKVSLNGVLAAVFNERRQVVGVRIFVPFRGLIHIDERAPASPFELPQSSALSVGAFRSKQDWSHRIRVRGSITAVASRNLVYLSDGEGNLAVELWTPCSGKPGALADFVGFQGTIDGRPGLRDAICRVIAESMPVRPTELLARDIIPPQTTEDGSGLIIARATRNDLKLITVVGTVIQVAKGLHSQTLTLASGDQTFSVSFPESPAWVEDTLESATQLKITGVCLIAFDEYQRAQSFRLLARNPTDIVVISRPAWLTLRRTIWIVAALVLLIVGSIAWIFVLRRHVAAKTIELRAANERLRLTLHSTRIAIWSWNIAQDSIEADKNCSIQFGLPVGQFPRNIEAFAALVHPDDRERVQRETAASVEHGAEYDTEFRVVWPDGVIRTLAARGKVYHKASGQPQSLTGVIWDVTERRQTEENLRTTSSRLVAEGIDARTVKLLRSVAMAANTVSEPEEAIRITLRLVCEFMKCQVGHAYALDNTHKLLRPTALWFLEDDKRFAELQEVTSVTPLGYGQGLPGRAWETLAPVWVADISQETNFPRGRLARDLGVAAGFAFPVVRDGQAPYVLEFFSRHIMVPDDELVGITKGISDTLRSLIVRSEVDRDLLDAKEAAEAANRAKSLFLANMSHEIRTPLNAILGYSQLMQRDPAMNVRAKENLNIINRSGEHLLDLINDILTMAKIEAGKAALIPVVFDLFDVLTDLELMFRLRTDEKGLRFEVLVESACEASIEADKGKMRQVLVNLLGNAVKFTEAGSVKLRVSMNRREDDSLRLFFAVEDTGPGIAVDEQSKLFRPFAQSESGRQNHGGTGLGLAISRELVRLMGGEIMLSSEPGMGSTFYFEIPIRSAGVGTTVLKTERRRVIGLQAVGEAPRVLVVDDEANNRGWLTSLLKTVGFTVQEAEDGKAAIRLWQEWKPRLILMDMRMPVMDGMETTRRIRALPGGRETVIFALTASALEEHRRAAMDSGVDDFLSKPCVEDELFQKTQKYLGVIFHFEEKKTTEADEADVAGEAFEADVCRKLPPELIFELQQAVGNGEKDYLDELIGQVAELDKPAARSLTQLADNYDYDALTQLLEEVRA